jgi:DNA repair protein RadC
MRASEVFEAPIDRLTRCGVDSLSPEELIALVLQQGRRRQRGLEAAGRLAQNFGSISKLARAEPEELAASSGITPDQAAAIVSCFRLTRLAEGHMPPPRLASAADAAGVAMREIGDATRERVLALSVTRRIESGELFR